MITNTDHYLAAERENSQKSRRPNISKYEKAVDIWRRRAIKGRNDLEEALDRYSIEFAYHSGKLGNDRLTMETTKEIFENGSVTAYTGDLRTLIEVRNYRDANELLLSSFGRMCAISESLIRDFHFSLTQGTYGKRCWRMGKRPGVFKRHGHAKGKLGIGTNPGEVHEDLSLLLDELNTIPLTNILAAAAYFHARFEDIRPFSDGNGRTGRLAMNYFLITNNHPPIIIHEEDRTGYFSALEEWDESHVLDPLIDYLEGQTIKTWEEEIRKEDGPAETGPSAS